MVSIYFRRKKKKCALKDIKSSLHSNSLFLVKWSIFLWARIVQKFMYFTCDMNRNQLLVIWSNKSLDKWTYFLWEHEWEESFFFLFFFSSIVRKNKIIKSTWLSIKYWKIPFDSIFPYSIFGSSFTFWPNFEFTENVTCYHSLLLLLNLSNLLLKYFWNNKYIFFFTYFCIFT